jgi:predicted RNase H-like HicB family nuclease
MEKDNDFAEYELTIPLTKQQELVLFGAIPITYPCIIKAGNIAEGTVYIGSFPDLLNTPTMFKDTYSQLLKGLKQFLDQELKVYLDNNTPIPEPSKVTHLMTAVETTVTLKKD